MLLIILALHPLLNWLDRYVVIKSGRRTRGESVVAYAVLSSLLTDEREII